MNFTDLHQTPDFFKRNPSGTQASEHPKTVIFNFIREICHTFPPSCLTLSKAHQTLSTSFPRIFNIYSSSFLFKFLSGKPVQNQALTFSHDAWLDSWLCLGVYIARVKRILNSFLVHCFFTRCVHNLLDKSVNAVSSLISCE